MPRNMSFMLTKDQVYAKTKTVTRRLGWDFLKPGDIVMACEQCQGLRKGETITRISPIRIISTVWCPLENITPEDCAREGFPEMTPDEFVDMFCKEMGVMPDVFVNRIEFEYVDREYSYGHLTPLEADLLRSGGRGENCQLSNQSTQVAS